jgi:hypothetical protein
MMIDDQLVFSNAQSVTGTSAVASTNFISIQSTATPADTGSGSATVSTGYPDFQGGTRMGRFAGGAMESATIYISVTALAGTGTCSLAIALQGDNRSDFGAAVVIETITTGTLAFTATNVYTKTMNPNFQKLGYRYYRLSYTYTATTVTASNITASIVLDVQTANPTFEQN